MIYFRNGKEFGRDNRRIFNIKQNMQLVIYNETPSTSFKFTFF